MAIRLGLLASALLSLSATLWSQGPATLPMAPVSPAAPIFAPAFRAEPIEMVCFNADLVIVAKVTELLGSQRLDLGLPGRAKGQVRDYEQFKVEPVKVLRDAHPPAEGKTLPKAIEIFSTKILVMATTTGASGRGVPESVCPVQKDKTYVMVLSKLPQRDAYLLAPGPDRLSETSDETLAKYEKACNLEKWPWSKAVDGLQMAIVAAPTTIIQVFNMDAMNGDGRSGANVGFCAGLAFRNTSDKPIFLNTTSADNPFALSVSSKADVAGEKADLYQALLGPDARIREVELKPGQVAFITAWGEQGKAQQLYFKLKGGKYAFQVIYENSTPTASFSARKLWVGKLSPPAAEVEVKDTGIRPVQLPPPK